MARSAVRYALTMVLTLASGCASFGMVSDGTSVSFGPAYAGELVDAVKLPTSGTGFFTPRRWRVRGLRYGTDEMVSALIYVGRRIDAELPGDAFAVADMSPRRGGPSAWHHSHQTGRDADLLFFVTDAEGHPLPPSEMPHFDKNGVGHTHNGREVHFDVRRNWTLVRAIIENPLAQAQFIFIADWLKAELLTYATQIGEPTWLLVAASYILHQPSDSLVHDDHMHVRVYCAQTDLSLGCLDRGPLRWNKKGYKYADQIPRRYVGSRMLAVIEAASSQALIAMATLPLRR
ncbi:MAG TPA: penicillin-insensitive murein endopeptidase [Kofleriaceae bacterium]|nr:penicillin-insensitive murein endopeptidase [Kofleriaceae bacterium]